MVDGDESNSYEELRKRNIERNEIFLRKLGLMSSRVEVNLSEKVVLSRARGKKADHPEQHQHRRSPRLACEEGTSSQSRENLQSRTSSLDKMTISSGAEKGKKVVIKDEAPQVELEEDEEMEDYESGEEDYFTDGFSDSSDDVKVDMNVDVKRAEAVKRAGTNFQGDQFGATSSAGNFQPFGSMNPASLAAGLQEMFMRAIFQATGSFVGSSTTMFVGSEAQSGGSPFFPTMLQPGPDSSPSVPLITGVEPRSTWKETAYNMSEAKRAKNSRVTRTSAGEGSDSQEDFRVPPNENAQQRSLRTRRLNRFRTKRAKELTENRKAVKKSPYVIHVDGTCRPCGIHKHKWRAAVRGQCGRLDPTKENMNHHPKQVIDSMWHALEREWEFEGYAHNCREMFERGATKFMRNRKMQLKYKVKRSVKGMKPGDVSPSHWAKIKDLMKKPKKDSYSSTSTEWTTKRKNELTEKEARSSDRTMLVEGTGDGSERQLTIPVSSTASIGVQELDVDARIESLESELRRLQKSREVGFMQVDDVSQGSRSVAKELSVVTTLGTGFAGSKGNVPPLIVGRSGETGVSKEKTAGKLPPAVSVKLESVAEDVKEDSLFDTLLKELNPNRASADVDDSQMDTGNVVRLYALIAGNKKEVAKGIVMSLAGSKFGRKVIPKGWRGVKITSYTSLAAGEICPIPCGWGDQVKNKSVKEASGRTVVWPDNLVHNILNV